MLEDEIIEALRGRVAAGRPNGVESSSAPELSVASPAELDAVEADLGFALPALLRRIYLEVANGGVGPFGGIEGLPPHGYTSDGDDVYAIYHRMQEDEEWRAAHPEIPPKVFFLCDYGCAMWALLDCRRPEGRMWWWDQGSAHERDITPAQWLSAWLADGSNILDS